MLYALGAGALGTLAALVVAMYYRSKYSDEHATSAAAIMNAGQWKAAADRNAAALTVAQSQIAFLRNEAATLEKQLEEADAQVPDLVRARLRRMLSPGSASN